MKITINTNDFFKVFPYYEEKVNELYESHISKLEEVGFKIDKIKNKETKELLNLQLGTKNDFDIKVIWENNQWELKNYTVEILTALKLKDEGIILNWDISSLDNIGLKEYLQKTYAIESQEYESKNYVGQGNIDWDTITSDVKQNWDNSFFFLENMKDEKFVENNKQLILEKTKDNIEILKEAIIGSNKFFDYVLQELPINTLLKVMSDKPGYLATIWNNKVKDLIKSSDYEAVLKQAKISINEELENYWTFHVKGNTYGDRYNYDYYDHIKERLYKDLKVKEKEMKKKAQESKKVLEEIYVLLENDNIKFNLVSGLLKNDIFKDDFKAFESMIIENTELKEIVINRGLYKTHATSKNFIDSLNQQELLRFAEVCNKKINNAAFASDDKRYFSHIVSEEKVLEIAKEINNNTIYQNIEWKIFSEIKPKNKELNKELFKINPKERFSELNKNEITEEDIRLYINAGGYLHEVKNKINIYELKDIETIKIIASKNEDFLSSKKIPENWKTNQEIILAALSNKNTLTYSNLNKENVLKLSEDKDFVEHVVAIDKSGIFYKLLPENLKNNKKVALSLLQALPDIEEVIKVLPNFILSDKKFTIELIKKSSKAIKYLKSEIWNDKEFVLTLFNEIEGTYHEAQVKKDLPEKIQFFLETFNIQENFYTFFNNYYLQKKLEKSLSNEDSKPKIKKLKI